MKEIIKDSLWEHTCPVCGKKFAITCSVSRWAYKTGMKDRWTYFCSWSCLREHEKNDEVIISERKEIERELSGEFVYKDDIYANNYNLLNDSDQKKAISFYNKNGIPKKNLVSRALSDYVKTTGHSLNQLSLKTGLSKDTIYNYAYGRTTPNRKNLSLLLKAGVRLEGDVNESMG